MAAKVYWTEVQNILNQAGLNAQVEPTVIPGPWKGMLDGKPFAVTIAPRDPDDRRDYLVISLYGQEEEKIVAALSELMGCRPFCKYLHRVNDEATATIEWDRKDPAVRLSEIQEDNYVHELQIF